MKIEPLSSGDLRIWMSDYELRRWGLCSENMKAGAADRAIRRMLGVVRQRHLFCTNGSVLVEALPLEGGCLFLFTLPLTKTAMPPQIYLLDSAETVLGLGRTLASLPCNLPPASLYRQGETYALILYEVHGNTDSCRRLLQEFGHRMGGGYVAASYIEEHSQPITIGDALQRLCAAYGYSSPMLPHPVR